MNPNAALSHLRTITLFAWGGEVLVVFLSPVPHPAAMPVCHTLLPVVDAAGIQVEKDEFKEERERAIAHGHTQFSNSYQRAAKFLFVIWPHSGCLSMTMGSASLQEGAILGIWRTTHSCAAAILFTIALLGWTCSKKLRP